MLALAILPVVTIGIISFFLVARKAGLPISDLFFPKSFPYSLFPLCFFEALGLVSLGSTGALIIYISSPIGILFSENPNLLTWADLGEESWPLAIAVAICWPIGFLALPWLSKVLLKYKKIKLWKIHFGIMWVWGCLVSVTLYKMFLP